MTQRAPVAGELTHLPGRPALEHAIEERAASGGSMVLVDIDRFRVVNDILGRRRADALLHAIHDHLTERARPCEIFWLGGDTFAVVGDLTPDRADALVSDLATLADEQGRLPLTASLGGVDLAEDVHPDDLMRRADIALRDAKAHGGGRVQWFDPVRHRDVLLQQQLRPEILRAVREDQFQMYYQPIVRLVDGALTGFEALLRWFHPERGSLSPGLFMPAVERDGLMGEVGAWVIDAVARGMSALGGDAGQALVTINLSRLQLLDATFAAQTLERLARVGVDPSSIGFELTESSVVDEGEGVRSQVSQLRASGALILIDDFGMGASSLASLHNLPIDVLKMDRAFVHGAVASERQQAVGKAIVEVGHALGLSVVAEGIETAEEMATVLRLGCDYGQGYYLGRPAPYAAAVELLRRPLRVPA